MKAIDAFTLSGQQPRSGPAANPDLPVVAFNWFCFSLRFLLFQKKMRTATLEKGWHTVAPTASPHLVPPASSGVP